MAQLFTLNKLLASTVLVLARLCLTGLGLVVVYGVVLRYVFNDAPPYVEQIALLLVISVAMFGAASGVYDSGHIGLDSVVKLLPPLGQRACLHLVDVLTMVFAVVLCWGSSRMALSTWHDTIPTLGLSEAMRYLPPIIAGVLILLFSFEHLMRRLSTPVAPEASWN